MRYVLTRRNRQVLERVVSRSTALIFDFDGTLAPIVDEPASAEMRWTTRRLLSSAAIRFPCAVVSGRRRDDVARRIEGTGVQWVVGNHGAEWGEPLDGAAVIKSRVRVWNDALRMQLGSISGVTVENKEYSLSIHYRRAWPRRRALGAIGRSLRTLDGAAVRAGKRVFEVLVPGMPDKGQAIRRLLRLLPCQSAIYVGDDGTDEDVFAVDSRALLSIRVGHSRSSRAPYYLVDQHEIDELLRALILLSVRCDNLH